MITIITINIAEHVYSSENEIEIVYLFNFHDFHS